MKESGATIDFNISAPNVAFYDDSCVSWRNMYSMIKVPSEYYIGRDEWGFPVYSFPFDLESVFMNNKITVGLYAEGKETYAEGISFADYANIIRNRPDSSDELKKLIEALLNYGAYAQQYFEYDTDNLANNGIYDSKNPVECIASATVYNDLCNGNFSAYICWACSR